MKITPKQYAQALYEMVAGKALQNLKTTIDNFFELLLSNNDLALADKIIIELGQVWDAKEGVLSAEVTSARTLEQPIFEEIKQYLGRLSSYKFINLSQVIDAGVLAGAVVRYQDKVIDMGLKGQLEEMKKSLQR